MQGESEPPVPGGPATVPEGLVIPPKPPLPAASATVVEESVVVVDDVVATDEEDEAASASALEALWDDARPDDGVDASVPALAIEGLEKTFGGKVAVAGLDWRIEPGTFAGLVGPNGAGKTTTLSMIAGLLRPDGGTIRIHGVDVVAREREAKRLIGVLPDRLRTFDRLTGRQLLTYAGLLRDLPGDVVEARTASLSRALDLTPALGRVVGDYSAGMTKKIMLAVAMIHAPRVLVLDEPFEALDPASSATILDILSAYTANGGTVVLSSHGMDLIERVCDRVAIMAAGSIIAEGTVDDVRGESSLEERFVEIVGGAGETEGLEWLHTFSG